MSRRHDLPSIRLANDQVSILLACRLVGLRIPDGAEYGRSLKIDCPFGHLYHLDGGADRAMRVYPDANRVFCFACASGYSPVRLVAVAWGLDQADAALVLLREAGIALPSPAAAWAKAISSPEPRPETGQLAEALKTFCARVEPRWATRQFDQDVATRLAACLALLDRVLTAADARSWLDVSKQVMSAGLCLPETTARVHSRSPHPRSTS